MNVFIALFAIVVAFAGCGGGGREEAASGTPIPVQTVAVAEQAVPALVTAVGTTVAFQTASVGSKLMSRVTEAPAREGDRVRKGDVLVRLDSQDLSARRRQAEAGLEEARSALENAALTLRRIQALYDQKATPKRNLDDARTGHARAQAAARAAEAGLKEVDATLAYSAVRAPFDGVVVKKRVEAGDVAAPGAPLLVVEDPGRMKVVARVSEGEAEALCAGGAAFVEIEAAGQRRLPCTVARIVPAADPASRTFDVEVVLDNADGRLRSGQFARLLIESGERRAVLVPKAGLVRQGQLEGVYVAEGGVARLRWVRVGRDHGDRAEVLSGLSGGERVIVTGLDRLRDGDRIK
jgi:RND family efflux transporter MFP subunit